MRVTGDKRFHASGSGESDQILVIRIVTERLGRLRIIDDDALASNEKDVCLDLGFGRISPKLLTPEDIAEFGQKQR